MNAVRGPLDRVPWWVSVFNPLARLLLAAGVPLGGTEALITIPGRRSGVPRTTPITVCEHGGRRGLISPFGEVNWVRNLRAAGRATITVRGRREEVVATELDLDGAARFIREVLAPHARRVRGGEWIVRTLDGIDLDRPAEAARGRPVFQLCPAEEERR